MHIDFDPLQVQWSVLANLEPEAIQFGGYNVFRGVPYQRGAGLGSVFRSVWRYLLPIGKEIGAAIGRQGLESGNRVLGNVLEGRDLKESLAAEGKAGLRNLLDKAAKSLDTQSGKGFDFKRYKNIDEGGGLAAAGRRHNKTRRNIHRLASGIGPPNFLPSGKLPTKHSSHKQTKNKPKKKRLRIDTLGSY